jgi:hypothetical protein
MASQRPKHVATPHSVINIILELCLTNFSVVTTIADMRGAYKN